MLAIPTTAKSFILPAAVCAVLLLTGTAARALPTDASRQAPAAPVVGVLLAHAQPQPWGTWQRHSKRPWRHAHRGRQFRREFRGRHTGHRREAHRRPACHPIRHVGFHRGYKVLLGSILCYDRHGRAFVLQGSRHILRYLHH